MQWMQCKSLWIKASAKCINVNVNVNVKGSVMILATTICAFNMGLAIFRNVLWRHATSKADPIFFQECFTLFQRLFSKDATLAKRMCLFVNRTQLVTVTARGFVFITEDSRWHPVLWTEISFCLNCFHEVILVGVSTRDVKLKLGSFLIPCLLTNELNEHIKGRKWEHWISVYNPSPTDNHLSLKSERKFFNHRIYSASSVKYRKSRQVSISLSWLQLHE